MNKGFSIIEILVSLGLVSLLGLAGYRVMTSQGRTVASTRQRLQTDHEVARLIDQISDQLHNAAGMSGSRATYLGSIVPLLTPEGCGSGIIPTNTVNSVFYDDKFEANGIVPLPGLRKADIDGAALELVNPYDDELPDGTNVVQRKSDGLRIAYFPIDSKPLELAFNVDLDSEGKFAQVRLKDASSFRVGDYAIIYDSSATELFRITDISGNALRHDPVSYWNLPWETAFSTTAFVQKVQLVSYSHDPDQKIVYRDTHIADDHFEGSSGSMAAGRVMTWEVAARKIDTFRIWYDAWDWDYTGPVDANGKVIRRKVSDSTRTPRAVKSIESCDNQLGYPLMKGIRLEVIVDGGLAISRAVDPANLVTVQSGGGPPGGLGDPYPATQPAPPPSGLFSGPSNLREM